MSEESLSKFEEPQVCNSRRSVETASFRDCSSFKQANRFSQLNTWTKLISSTKSRCICSRNRSSAAWARTIRALKKSTALLLPGPGHSLSQLAGIYEFQFIMHFQVTLLYPSFLPAVLPEFSECCHPPPATP